jgi:hypothetical protein
MLDGAASGCQVGRVSNPPLSHTIEFPTATNISKTGQRGSSISINVATASRVQTAQDCSFTTQLFLSSHLNWRRLPWRCSQHVANSSLVRVLLLNCSRLLDGLRPTAPITRSSVIPLRPRGAGDLEGTSKGRLLCGLGPLRTLALARKLAWKFSAVSMSVE